VRAPALPSAPLTPAAGRWLWTCRAGFEPHLFEELAWAGAGPRLLGPALVESDLPALPPAFARMGFLVTGVVKTTGKDTTAELAARLLAALPRASEASLSVLGWAPDADRYAPLQALAKAQADAVTEALGTRAAASPEEALTRGGFLGQLCLLDAERTALGVVRAPEAWSLAPGGRQRMWREAGPSRAALKLEEALTLSPLVPGRGEVCADLGAAPGGWTQRLLSRGARVIAVDPAKMAPELMRNGKLRHVQESAFAFEPEEPVDWLFCDMAWRPLEVAQLLAKWARRGWADALVANLKLPMKDKNPIVFRARHLLEAAGWTRMTIRQLYHDRDEVTVIARRS
jgi:23S rRNA (cytidine2498-2'-O)-methyltransferase